MVEEQNVLEGVLEQIHILKITYGEYLTIKNIMDASCPKTPNMNQEEYERKMAEKFDEQQRVGFINIAASFCKAASFVVFEIESLKESLIAERKDIDELMASYTKIERAAYPEIPDAKRFVQAANNIKVKLTNAQNIVKAGDKIKNLGQSASSK